MTPNIHSQIHGNIESFEFCDSELVIAFTYAVGTNYKPVQETVENILNKYGYHPKAIRISDLIPTLTRETLSDSSEIDRVASRMTAGNNACRSSGRREIWALAAIAEINKIRGADITQQRSLPRTAHLIFSLKRPEEVATLRKVYGDAFFLIGVFATERERIESLVEKNAPKLDAIRLIRRDEEETSDEYGQQTRETFRLADVFVQLRRRAYVDELSRFFALVFSDPYVTPTQHEHAMFLAYASSLRSGQLGRQVGAAIASKAGDVLAVGCNDVPRPGGGLYWPGPHDNRDAVLGIDTNDQQRDLIVGRLIAKLPENCQLDSNGLRKSFRSVLDITEYGRAVHAEMDALLTCARSGVSPVGGTLYTTTFPCHNCTRHIIAAGIERVIYIEPYAKSRAEELHEDAIVVEEKAPRPSRRASWRVPFTHFVGIGPRRYFDLFSLNLSSGHELVRKDNGRRLALNLQEAWPRIPLSHFTYIQREVLAIEDLDLLPQQLEMFETKESKS
ncbi:MAG TPA: anti-phage dCTP deaminase [Terracidiphilus sp.]|nr:anti-phage dCTP deaminase [Terracidiphilus sp.]